MSLILLILLILLVLCLICMLQERKHNLEIVIARYNEKLGYLNNPPFNKYPVIIYNKSDNENFTKPDRYYEVIKLPNVGREMHTYLYHIIENYDKLAEITVFLPGSVDIEHKIMKANKIFEEIEKYNKKTVIICAGRFDNLKNNMYDFVLEKYKATGIENNNLNNKDDLVPSKIRPFGKWYEHHFGDNITTCLNINLVFSMSKQDILKKPKSYYKKLIKELDSDANHETAHYFERSVEAVFYPISEDSLV